METDNLILDSHHGSRKGYSTASNKTILEYKLNKDQEENKIDIVISCDLSKAFETIDHFILLQKLEFYGVKGNELKLFKSFLTNRTQFTQIGVFRSNILTMPSCICLQGSKNSGTFYTIYNNEVPLIHQLLDKPEILF